MGCKEIAYIDIDTDIAVTNAYSSTKALSLIWDMKQELNKYYIIMHLLYV